MFLGEACRSSARGDYTEMRKVRKKGTKEEKVKGRCEKERNGKRRKRITKEQEGQETGGKGRH